jgi:hypothetical protein
VTARPVLRRAGIRAAVGMTAPALGGAVVVLAVLAGQPVDGLWQRTVQALLLVPAVLVHCHSRADTAGLGVADTAVVSIAAGLVAYAFGAVGLAAGAALTLAVVLAAQTGALAAVAQVAGLLSLAMAVAGRRVAG